MSKYLLKTEKNKINNLIEELNKSLNQETINLENIKKEFYQIIINCKDNSIEELLYYFLNSLINKITPLLTNNITSGLQVGIKNKYFNITAYGGRYNKDPNSKPIDENTFFSFDSISKLITSTIIMQDLKNKKLNLNTPLKEYNPNFNLNTSIESILKFTANLKTNTRIDNLPPQETIKILKQCQENLIEKEKYKNFYEYSDIGYMILRLSINNFLTKLDNLLQIIDNQNLTYKNLAHQNNITGGKITEEYITPDQKGRNIPFPGHTGLYGNIEGLLNIFYQILYTENILNEKDRTQLFTQPYPDPIVYNKDGTQQLGKNKSPQYMAKISGIYRKPTGIIDKNYNKLASCDMSEKTTDDAKASTGTCGSWIVSDNLSYNNKFGFYISGLLTNPYSFVNNSTYPNNINEIPHTPLQVNKKGIILGYSTKLNQYKEIITEYSLILTLLTEYIKEIDETSLNRTTKTLTKKII